MSRMAIAIPLAALAAFAALAAVALSGGSDPSTGDSMETKVIELESNPTTGYSWAIYYSDGLHVESEFIPPDSELMGAPGKQVFTITAESPGTYHFKAEYKRPWETVEPVQVYEVDLEFRSGLPAGDFPPFCQRMSQS